MVDSPSFADAISGIESGGRYGLLGPVTKTGDRAYGKYQVMGSNIPQWTAKYYGQPLTPQEFLANPSAQDAVFQGKFVGEYVPKYGPVGASKAWFAGEKGMNNPNAKDMLGTTVADYGNKFAANMGPNYSAPLTPGTQAPPLPAPINIGSAPMPAAPQGQQPQQSNPLMALAASPQQQTQQPMPMQQTQFAQNPIEAMAFSMPKPNMQGLQQLLAKNPTLRGLLS